MEERKYVPSSGTEGMWFIELFCCNCIHGKYEHTGDVDDNPCEILTKSFMTAPDPIDEWIWKDNKPYCKEFVKFDWRMDDDGNWITPPPKPTDDPNQLCMPFIFDEIGVPTLQETNQ